MAFLSSFLSQAFLIRRSCFTWSRQLSKHGSCTEIQRLCIITQAIITYFRFFNRHSVFLCKIINLPFIIPQAFSVTQAHRRALCWSIFVQDHVYLRCSFLADDACFGKAISPIVTKCMFSKSLNAIPLSGIMFPETIFSYNDALRIILE